MPRNQETLSIWFAQFRRKSLKKTVLAFSWMSAFGRNNLTALIGSVLEKRLKDMRWLKNKAFFGSISDKALETFQ
jgi:hypothetical protein